MNSEIEVPEVTEKKDKGFTLVELLIVIVILGILATVTVFAVRGITDKGQTSACQADKKTLETATEAYFAQNGGTTIPVTAPGTALDTLVTAGFLRSAPTTLTLSAAGVIGIPASGSKCTAAMIA